MSTSIGMKAVYKNGVTVNRGLFNKINADMRDGVDGLFSTSELRLLVRRLVHEIGTKDIKGNMVTVTLNKSGSKGHIGKVDIYMHIDELAENCGMFSAYLNK